MTPEAAVLLVSALALSGIDPRNNPNETARTEITPTPKPLAYSVPWQLRPVIAPNVIRVDTSSALYQDARGGGITTASILTGSWRIPGTGPPSAGLAPVLRLPLVRDSSADGDRTALGNLLVGISYAMKLNRGFRANGFLGTTVPIGMGGGNSPDGDALAARTKGPNARAQFDNALFAVNDVAVIPGVSGAWIKNGLTLQLEATLFYLVRVRGAAAQPEATKTNFTTGFHVGYFVFSSLSIGSEVRYQRWINAPFAAEKEATNRDALSIAFGPRMHFPIGNSLFLRPGLAYQRGLDAPLATAGYHILQVDVPLFFM